MTACSTATAADADADADKAEASSTVSEPETKVFTDEVGREVELEIPVEAAYADFIYQAEAIRLVGAGDAIVAQGSSTDPNDPLNATNKVYLESFGDAVNVGTNAEPNWEAIVESGAKVAFIMRNSPYQDAITKLEPFGIKVFVVTGWDPEVLREYVPILGEIFGHEEDAAEASELFDDIEVILDDRLAGVTDKKTVYYENNADYATGVPGSGWHDVIVDAGGENIFGDVKVGDDESSKVHSYPIDPVEVVNRNPDVIFHNGVDGLTYGYDKWPASEWNAQASAIASRAGWGDVDAVKNGEIYVTNNFLYSALGKKVGAVVVAKTLYPELFSDVEVDDYFGRWLGLQGVDPVPSSDYILKYEG